MANQPQRRRPSPAVPEVAAPPSLPEPEVRRWPHPTGCGEPETPNLPAALHYLHCSLSYQNQLLSEIRALLEGLSADGADRQDGK